MPNRALVVLAISTLMLIFYSCGEDSPTGTQTEIESDHNIVSGLISALDDEGGIQDALLELSKSDSVLQETYSEVNGEFSFTGVEAGQYEVTMSLPQGYRESGTTSRTLQVVDDISIEFEGEPIKEETTKIKAGEQDTIATASGAFVTVNVSNATSDMEVTISEMVDEEGVNGTRPVKIQIRPFEASKNSISPAKRMLSSTSTTAASVNISLGQKVKNTGTGSLVFNVESEDGIIPLYADPEQKTLVDPKTRKENTYYIHSISTPSSINSEFSFYYKRFDNSCDNKNRDLESVPSDDEGQIPLILVHGIQPTWGLCDDFDTYDPLNLDDEEINTFDGLASKLLKNSEINDKYRLYTYKYPTNAPIQEASDELWNQIESNGQIQKPVILAHSMGGLVARKMVATEGDEMIRGLITLGTPHNGTPIANIAEWIGNEIAEYCSSLTNSVKLICLADRFNSGILPNSPGLLDLRKENVEENFNPSDVNKDKIFTLGGDLDSSDEIASYNSKTSVAIYRLGYGLMAISKSANDGMVPLLSAIPDWTDYQAVLEGHDHSEMVDGNNLNSNSVFVHLQIILSLLAQDENVTAPNINTIASNPNPSNLGQAVNFFADMNGNEPIDCEWNFDDGSTSTNCNATNTYQNSGIFEVSFTASNDGGTDETTLTHEVVQSGKAKVIYVDSDAIGNNDGSSWESAFNNLQDALAQAENGEEIWVADGTYFPDQGSQEVEGDRQATFQLKNNVEIYGGFSGAETARDMRDWEINKSILSGDIIDFDSYNVVTANNTDSTARIDGFTIRDGDAREYGGGMYIENGDPIVKNIHFINNNADKGGGGAMFNRNSNPIIDNVIFESNISDPFDPLGGFGGGVLNIDSEPFIINCKFINNKGARKGGAIYNKRSNPMIVNTIFSSNFANYNGGAIYNSESNIKIINSTFSENGYGGPTWGLTRRGTDITNDDESNSEIINSIFWMASDVYWSNLYNNHLIYNYNSSESIISNSIVKRGIEDINNLINNGNNLSSDPYFIDADGPDGIFGTMDDNLRLQSDSPAINSGINEALDLDGDGSTTDDVPVDLDENSRIQNGKVDIGAFERSN